MLTKMSMDLPKKKFGTATEEGDSVRDSVKIAMEYGVKFKTESGKKGTFIGGKIEFD